MAPDHPEQEENAGAVDRNAQHPRHVHRSAKKYHRQLVARKRLIATSNNKTIKDTSCNAKSLSPAKSTICSRAATIGTPSASTTAAPARRQPCSACPKRLPVPNWCA